MSKYLCLDLGTAHTGLAVSEEGELVTPVGTIFSKDADSLIGKLVPYIARFDPEKIVLGVPEYGPLNDYSKEIAQKIDTIFSGEIIFFSERLSSMEARLKMKEAGKTLAKKKLHEHQTAAAIILQKYLESL